MSFREKQQRSIKKNTNTLNKRSKHKTTKHKTRITSYYEPLAHCSPAMAPNLIEAIPESNKHLNAVTRK